MNDIILSHKRWQQIFDVQLIIALIITVLELITKKQRNFGNIFQLVFLILIVGLNFYVQFNRHNSSKLNFEITRWLNLLVFSSYFTIIWLVVGNYLIFSAIRNTLGAIALGCLSCSIIASSNPLCW